VLIVKAEEDDLLGPTRRLAGAGQPAVAGNGIDRARFTDVRSAGKRHLATAVLKPVAWPVGSAQVLGLAQQFRIARYGFHKV